MSALFHVIPASQWRQALDKGVLAPPSLAAEGFVHFSYADQVAGVANRLYAELHDLIVVEFDAGRLGHPVVDEDSYGSGQKFPHVYAAIPVAAAVDEHDLPRESNGVFVFDRAS